MKKQKTPEEAKREALRILSRGDVGEAKLAEKLGGKGFDPATVKGVLTELRQLGYINDRSLCERLVQYLARERLMGNRRIEATLLKKGFSFPLIREILEKVREEWPEEEALNTYVNKKGPENLTPGKLLYQGFPPAMVYEVLQRSFRNDDSQ